VEDIPGGRMNSQLQFSFPCALGVDLLSISMLFLFWRRIRSCERKIHFDPCGVCGENLLKKNRWGGLGLLLKMNPLR
jgi:hypothetical protein